MTRSRSVPRPSFRVKIPECRDPFINTPLVSLGPDDGGVERFWISTWNSTSGTTAAHVGEDGDFTLYRFPDIAGFYSCAQAGKRTLWLCNVLSSVVRFDLADGQYQAFETGAPQALVFQGMPYDPPTGKVFAAANVMRGGRQGGCITAFSFDTRARRTVRLHEAFCEDAYMRASFPNGDGTWSLVFMVPQVSLVRWDPNAETVTSQRLPFPFELGDYHLCGRLIRDERDRVYFPRIGWYDGRRDAFAADGPKPEREATWFARHGRTAWGVRGRLHQHNVEVVAWDLESGAERPVATVENMTPHGLNASARERLVGVSVYGDFTVRDAADGRLLSATRLPATAVQHPDCLERIDRTRLLGTPFITQRFWEVELDTGRGRDCGRAAPGWGEILQTWKIGGKVYMAEYGGGTLVEYDPAEHPHFPENPRLVAEAPRAMRPIAAAEAGPVLWYACSAPYGKLGSTVTRYDTRSGLAVHAVNPLTDQKIASLWYDAATNTLLAGSSISSDCDSARPSADRGRFARLDPDTLEVLDEAAVPEGIYHAAVLGPLGRGRYVARLAGEHPALEGGVGWTVLTVDPFAIPDFDDIRLIPQEWRRMVWAGRAGLFAVLGPRGVDLWDLRRGRALTRVHKGAAHGLVVKKGSLYVIGKRDIRVYDRFLSGQAG